MAWVVPGRVIEISFGVQSNDAVFVAMDNELVAALDTAAQPVHVIVDTRSVTMHPSAQTALTRKFYKHPLMGSLVVVGLMANPIMHFLASLVAKSMGIKIKDCSTPEEARAYLASMENV